MLLLLFLPKQLQGDAGSFEFAVQVGIVRLQVPGLEGHRWPVQPGLQFHVAQMFGLRPVQSGSSGVSGNLAEGGFGNAQRCANLALLCNSCNVCRILLMVSLGLGIAGFRSKNRAAYASFGSLRTVLGCPLSKWNALRCHRGMVSAMTLDRCTSSAWNRVRHRVKCASVPDAGPGTESFRSSPSHPSSDA